MARLKLLLAFFSLVILAAGAFGVAYYYKNFFHPSWEVTREIEGDRRAAARDLPDLGLREFAAAENLLLDNEPLAARDRLLYLMEYYPESSSLPLAKHIVGEINMDTLLSRAPMPGKEEHVVKRGDLLNPLARRYQTSINYMMRAGGRTNHVIFPDDRLVVYPLNFKVRISLGDMAITILTPEENKFFKEYAIRSVNLPPQLRPPLSAKVAELVAWHEGRPVSFESPHYFEAGKWIRTDRIGLFIRPYGSGSGSGESGSADGFGVMVDKPDLEEMFAYLRPSNPVTLMP